MKILENEGKMRETKRITTIRQTEKDFSDEEVADE